MELTDCMDVQRVMTAVISSGVLLLVCCGIIIYRLGIKLEEMEEDRDWWMKHSKEKD